MINFAVIGTSKITESFIDAAKQDGRFNLQAVYSRNIENAQAFAKKHQAALCFNDLTQLADSQEIDAVYIASPNSFHARQAIALLQAGKHVLCEKPVAVNSLQLSAMVAAARENNRCFMEAMMISFLPNYQQIKQHLHKIGKIRKYSASFCQYSSRYPAYLQGDNPNTFNLAFANGSLVDIGIYPLYPLLDIFGLPDKISSQCTKLASGVDACGDVLLNYHKQELQAVVSHSKVSNSMNCCELQGELGRITWQHASLFNQVSLHLNDGSSTELTLPQTANRMTYELTHFIDLIESGDIESSINSWQLSQDVVQVIEQVRQQQEIVYPGE
jgi:scyllo-inositol 2-dehydrogenase (NADP+)